MNNKATQFFRRFIIRPLLNAIDLDESIDFLTEMRHVVIVFANFIVPRTTASDLIDILNRIYIDLCSIVSRYEGIVNKVSLFDKDMMFLIIFGLRGFKHNMESQIALRCADEIHETFKLWPEVITVSIAVTSSGASYCGVIGHTLRREYSVISVTVNKAARFMMAYTDVVSCDRETMMHSQMDLKHFTLLPARHMKGLSEEVVAYAFKEIEDSQFVERPVEYKTPVLGRNDILLSSRCHLIMAILNHNYVACEMEPHEHHISCFVIKGDTQQGKTRILDELFNMCFKNNLRCIKLTLHPKQLMKPYSTIALIMTRLLKNLDNDNVQNLIAEKLHDLGIDEYLSVLNPVFNINFEPSDIIQLMNNEQLMEIRQHVFKVLIETVTDEFWAILIDDLEYSDQESFTLFKTFFKSNSVFMFLSVGRRWRISKAQMKVLHNRHVMHHQIEPIANEYQKALACLYLNVSALSLELEKFLYANSCGIPGWIKTCMMKLLQSKKIEIRIISIRQATGMDHTIQNQELEKCQSLTEIEENLSNEWDMFNQCFIDDYKIQTPSESDDQLIRVAVLTQQIVASDFIGNLSIDSDLMVYDSLSAYDQLVCKCASSLGLEFSRAMLLYVISNSTDRLIGMAMVKMFEIHIFTCGSAFSSNEKKGSDIFVCNCKNCKVPESCRDLPKYASCALIKFHSENFRKCVYDSLTDKLRLEYHTRSLNYLYHKTRRCDPCGNAPFPILVAQDLDFEFIDGYYMTKNNSLQRMVNHFESLNLPIVAYHKNSIATNLLRRKKEMKFRSIVLNYMNYDFLDCKCNTILLKTFNNAIDHCYGAEQTVKLIESRIELASVCIKTSNIPRAQSLLKQAQIELNVGGVFLSYKFESLKSDF